VLPMLRKLLRPSGAGGCAVITVMGAGSWAREWKPEMIIIDAPHFYAAVICKFGHVIRYAPILKYMRGWSEEHVISYARAKGWTVLIPPK